MEGEGRHTQYIGATLDKSNVGILPECVNKLDIRDQCQDGHSGTT